MRSRTGTRPSRARRPSTSTPRSASTSRRAPGPDPGDARRAPRRGAAPLGPRPAERAPGGRRRSGSSPRRSSRRGPLLSCRRGARRDVPPGTPRSGAGPAGPPRTSRPRSAGRAPPPVPGRPPGRPVPDRRRHDRRRADRGRPRRAALPAPVAPGAGSGRPWTLPWLVGPPARARRLPVGSRADPPVAAQVTCSRRPTRSTTRSRTGATPELAEELGDLLLQVVLHAQLAAEEGVFDLTDVQARDRGQDRPPPPARLRRRGGAHGARRQPPVGADQGRRAGRPTRRSRQAEPAEAAPGALDGISALAAGPRGQPGDAGAGGATRLRLAVDRGRASTRSTRRLAELLAGRGPTPSGPRSSATCCMVLVNVGAQARHRGRGRPAGRQRQVPATLRATSSGWPPSAGVALRDLDFAALDALWDQAKGSWPARSRPVRHSSRRRR